MRVFCVLKHGLVTMYEWYERTVCSTELMSFCARESVLQAVWFTAICKFATLTRSIRISVSQKTSHLNE